MQNTTEPNRTTLNNQQKIFLKQLKRAERTFLNMDCNGMYCPVCALYGEHLCAGNRVSDMCDTIHRNIKPKTPRYI